MWIWWRELCQTEFWSGPAWRAPLVARRLLGSQQPFAACLWYRHVGTSFGPSFSTRQMAFQNPLGTTPEMPVFGWLAGCARAAQGGRLRVPLDSVIIRLLDSRMKEWFFPQEVTPSSIVRPAYY